MSDLIIRRADVPSLFGGQRLQMTDSIRLTIESLRTYIPLHPHVAVAWSGGKDSTTLVTLVVHLMETGQIPRPETFTVLYADTRMELLPLWASAHGIRTELQRRGIDVRTVMAPLDERFLVYMLGRGVPPPNNRTLRWCTAQIKVEPMELELLTIARELGKPLVLTGVRQGESAVRDGRIALSCSKDGSECGQGWYQTLPDTNTLAPLLHWRVCHVWDWLSFFAPTAEYGAWPTRILADAYGGDEAEEINARTGCVGCPLAERDVALDAVIALPHWAYLQPLKEIRPIYRMLRLSTSRLRKLPGERRKDGTLVENQQRMGPIKLAVRLEALDRLLDIQARVNQAAGDRPHVDFLNAEEEARIRALVDANTWPNRWTGDEPGADEPFDAVVEGGVQPRLDGIWGS